VTEASPCAATRQGGRSNQLALLVTGVAAGDRAAFRCLYAFLAMRVWRTAVQALPDQLHVPAVTRSTFVELWHLARSDGGRSQADTRDWVAAIADRQIDDRLRTLHAPCPFFGDYDRHVHRELAALLGAGPATIRAAPAMFARVDDLELALPTIAAVWARPSRVSRCW
jgi:DNA-directed RNA polymerase specialized sigma24 family protein